jgi:hypothetical protein
MVVLSRIVARAVLHQTTDLEHGISYTKPLTMDTERLMFHSLLQVTIPSRITRNEAGVEWKILGNLRYHLNAALMLTGSHPRKHASLDSFASTSCRSKTA